MTRAVLFDLDGTLLDTAPDMVGAINQLLREEGRTPHEFAQLRPYVSHGAAALVRLGFPEAADAAFNSLRLRFLDIYRGLLTEQTQAFEGVPEALAGLEAAGIPWGIVTNKPGWLTEPLLQELKLHQRARVVVSADTLAHRKPHPAPLLHAAEKLGLLPSQCIYIGDAERDVLAARAAGMPVFVALFGYIPKEERPEQWPATGWLQSPREMSALLASVGHRDGPDITQSAVTT
jgi:N-acetyl-D-muramate 6-phosphate phosphatase